MFRCEFSHLQYQQPNVRMKLRNLRTALICPVHPAFLSHVLLCSSGVSPRTVKGVDIKVLLITLVMGKKVEMLHRNEMECGPQRQHHQLLVFLQLGCFYRFMTHQMD